MIIYIRSTFQKRAINQKRYFENNIELKVYIEFIRYWCRNFTFRRCDSLYCIARSRNIFTARNYSLDGGIAPWGKQGNPIVVLNGPVGLLYDRMPRRRLLIAAMSIGACSSIFYAISSGFWALLLGRVFWGLAWSLLWIGGNSVVSDISTEEDRGKKSGIYQMWFFTGVARSLLPWSTPDRFFGFRQGQ